MTQTTTRPLWTLVLNISKHQAPNIKHTRPLRSNAINPNTNITINTARLFSQSIASRQHQSPVSNRILAPFRTPSQFQDALRLCSANNTLLLTLFTTSACTPCRVITPLLTSLIETRPSAPSDKYAALAFAELELDSPDASGGGGFGTMMDLGVEYGVTSMPTLMGFGGRRAERVTERLVDTRMLCDERRMASWVDEQMGKGDPFSTSAASGGGGEGAGKGGLLSRIFG
ncbi:hypothetical protein LTR84_012727 [Exophiala bonariae]|uniref:Thioredoxin domain-containing protein n=1 Tax=Exophiala bonariae TaxID=1690606 RepID=A0AAV9NF57_9EURO|nr:hypothetical protein LTR84_012727 [Exophiala bonariae]